MRPRISAQLLSALLIFPLLTAVAARSAAAAPKISIAVDASDAPRKIFHARLTIQASPGQLTLYYPQWIPGEHGPTGPIADVAGVKFSAGGNPIPWRRDLVDMYAFHLEVPAGANSIQAELDYLSPATAEGFSSGASATEQLALISWNQLLLYPRQTSGGRPLTADQIMVTSSLKLPSGWKYGTALTTTGNQGDSIQFGPVSVETLIDSPVLAGAYFRKIPLSETDPPAALDVAADSEAALEITPEHLTHIKNLIAETGALYGARHYRHYDFLLTLSDHTAHFGLEHHESSDDRISERSLIDTKLRELSAGLLPHEMTHSWNGKYRRPAGLATPDYNTPMKGELLWVYEGLTSYLGPILTARSGLLTPELFREDLALDAAEMDRGRPGREWRNLQDTADAAQDLYNTRGQAWQSWRRSTDFYPESELIWLEADVLIRRQSQGRKSLDDFCKLFLGPPSGPPKVVPYTFDDVVNTLNQVIAYDWRSFFTTRLQAHGPGAPLGGISGSGWKLVYNSTKPEMVSAAESARHFKDFRYSLGITVRDDGSIPDTIRGFPAANAGIGPGMVLVAVNGRSYDHEGKVLRDALRLGKANGKGLELLVRNGDYFRTFKLDYHDGEQYPHLVRDETRPDLLGQIIQPHAAGVQSQPSQ